MHQLLLLIRYNVGFCMHIFAVNYVITFSSIFFTSFSEFAIENLSASYRRAMIHCRDNNDIALYTCAYVLQRRQIHRHALSEISALFGH